ncbi:hypothetical protein [Klebsiella pneumoniae]|uniref:hypothetical protein n=1 Tax=Klebsiella pneumoniae TaxID=573 RepID=UPI0020CFC186|nr:hypothetical protein [Klebsiella pneumoniae]
MAIYCVTYDLKAPGRNYDEVFDYLKNFTYCKHLESFWLIDTTLTAAQLRDGLKSRVDSYKENGRQEIIHALIG